MSHYLRRRLWVMVPTFFGITVLTFVLLRLAPGEPFAPGGEGAAGANVQRAIDTLRQREGLDRPILEHYASWVRRVATLDFGRSSQDRRPVVEKIGEALPKTLLLSFLALFFGVAIAIPLGVLSAVRRGSSADRIATGVVFLLYAVPSFWAAIFLLRLFASDRFLGWFPMQGLTSDGFGALSFPAKVVDLAWHLVLPVSCLTYGTVASLSRYVRTGTLAVLSEDYVRTARAKGLPEGAVLRRHVLPNAMLPVISYLGVAFPHVIAGSVIVEQVFGIRGMGLLAFEAILNRDIPMVMGITTLVALFTLLSTLGTDLVYAWVDPRIRVEGTR